MIQSRTQDVHVSHPIMQGCGVMPELRFVKGVGVSQMKGVVWRTEPQRHRHKGEREHT